MTTLAGITLSDHLVLSGLENAPPVATSQRRTIMGVSVVQTAPVSGGRALALVGDNLYTLSQLQALNAAAASGLLVVLEHHRGTFDVLITGINMQPTQEHSNPTSDDWYSGEILMTEC